MSSISWAIFSIVTLGFILFLYGANYYDATVGWTGVFLFIGGIVFYLILFAYGILKKTPSVQKP